MRLSTSNILLGVTPTVGTGENVNNDPASVTDPDFSTSYTGADNNKITFFFESTGIINYVAVAGLNIEGNKDYTSYVRVTDGSSIITTNYVIRNNCVMLTFAARAFTSLRVVIYNAVGNTLPEVRFIAAGTYLQLPLGGENAGYNREFLNRNIKTKSTLSNLAAPTSVLTKRVAPRASLKIPNMTKAFSEVQWQTFLDFSEDNYFFIVEQDTDEEITQNSSAYLCFEVTNSKTTAHPQM